MSQQVQFRPRQKVTSVDLTNAQSFKQSALDTIVKRGVTDGRYYTGQAVSKSGQAEITVAPGEFWSNGAVYIRVDSVVQSVFNYLPVATKKYLTVVTWGVEQELDVQPRDFLIDTQTRATQPQPVAMEHRRSAQFAVVAGTESAAPVRPIIDGTVIAVAHLFLDQNGIVSIEMVTDNVLPSVEQAQTEIDDLTGWRKQTGQRIDTLASDLLNLRKGMPPDLTDALSRLVVELNALRQEVRRPPTATKIFTDQFPSDWDSDTAHAGYAAAILNGLNFPLAGTATSTLALLNGLEPKLKTVGGVTLPDFDEVARLSVGLDGTADGALSINQYPTTTTVYDTLSIGRTSTNYGDWYTAPLGNFGYLLAPFGIWGSTLQDPGNGAYNQWWRASADPNAHGFFTLLDNSGTPIQFEYQNVAPKYNSETGGWVDQQYKVRRAFQTQQQEPYTAARTVTTTQTGAVIATTFLNVNAGWYTGFDVLFDTIGPNGDVKLFLTNADASGAKPDQVLASVTVNWADLRAGAVRFPIAPTMLGQGQTYGLILSTTGNHKVRTVSGNKYAQGTLSYKPNNETVWTPVPGAADLCFAAYAARLKQTRVEVTFQTLTLTGGIRSIHISAGAIVPAGTALSWEVRYGGNWIPLVNNDIDVFAASPTSVEFRGVWVGTTDLMPGLKFAETQVTVQRAGGALNHFSKTHTLTTPTTSVKVETWWMNYKPAKHTVGLKLEVAGSVVNPATTSVTYPDEAFPTKAKVVSTFTPSSTGAYKVQIQGSSTDANDTPVCIERQDSAF